MKLLLDTHVLLWWFDDDARLGRRARGLIADASTDVVVSMASLWEIAIKHRIGKLPASVRSVQPLLDAERFTLLPIEIAHVQVVEAFGETAHSDPFDHLILAQAKVENAVLMTNDDVMRRYGVRCLPTA